jgi:hypothetical protein
LARRGAAAPDRDRRGVPSLAALRDWYASSQYAEAFVFRAAAVKRRMIFVAGVDDA